MLEIKKDSCRLNRRIICFFLTLFLVCPGYAQVSSYGTGAVSGAGTVSGTTSNIRSLLSNRGQVLFSKESNSLMVIDYPENLKKVEEYLEMVDVPPQQVHIEARVVEVKLQGETSLGIDWSAFAASGGWNFGNFDMYSASASEGIRTTGVINYTNYSKIKEPPISGTTTNTTPFALTLAQNNINLVMRALADQYDTDILSAPSVTTINNHEAIIQMIDIYPWAEPTITSVEGRSTADISYNVNFEEAGIILKVTPTISENGQIVMDLIPEISEKTNDYSISTTSSGTTVTYTVPIIETRQAKTKVVVRSGDTLIIGGLIKNKKIASEVKIPLLGDIPYLGYLFKTQKKTMDKRELVIFVSPTIINAPEMAYSASLEKKIRKDIEGSRSKLEMTPLKEVAAMEEEKRENLAAQEKQKQEALAEKEKRQKEALQRKVDSLYAEAVSLYANDNLVKARKAFQIVLRYDPAHQESLNFLETKIPQALKEKETEKVDKGVVKKAERQRGEEAEKMDEQAALEKKHQEEAEREKKETQTRKEQEQMQKEEAKKQEALRKKANALKAKELYVSALSLYRKKQYNEAYAKFKELEASSPGYGRSDYYIVKIFQLIESQERAKQAQELYAQEQVQTQQAKETYQAALYLYKIEKYSEAYAKFEEVQKLKPGYLKTSYYLSKIPEIMKRKERAAELLEQKERQKLIKEMLNSCE